MFLKEDGQVVLNEVNTLPGMTSYSRYPRMMAAAGLPLGEVIDRMVRWRCGTDDEPRTSSSSTSSCPESAGTRSTRRGTTSPASRWTDTWPIASSARGPCARPWSEREKRPHPSASACSCGMAIARNAPWIAFCAGRNSRRMAGRSPGTTRTSTGPRCSSKGYVAAKSGHSRGSTVDLTLYHLATGELARWAVTMT